jgi:hypothetical protein
MPDLIFDFLLFDKWEREMRKANWSKIVVYCFLIVVLGSFVMLVPATANYLEFWAALSNFYLRVDSFSWSNVTVDTAKSIDIIANLTLFQNSSYVGLKYHSVDIKIYYADTFDTLFEMRFWLSGLPVEPFSRLELSLKNETASDARHFLDLKSEGKMVELFFATSVNLYLLGQSTADRVYIEDVPLTV